MLCQWQSITIITTFIFLVAGLLFYYYVEKQKIKKALLCLVFTVIATVGYLIYNIYALIF